MFSQLPIDEQARNVVDIISDPDEVDVDTFGVAVEIVVDLFTNALDTTEVSTTTRSICIYHTLPYSCTYNACMYHFRF